jgi:hypothetical protein
MRRGTASSKPVIIVSHNLAETKLSSEPLCFSLSIQAPVVRPCFVPFLFLLTDEWCLVVTIQEVYLGTVYTRFMSFSSCKVVISTNPSAKVWLVSAGVLIYSATDYFFLFLSLHSND